MGDLALLSELSTERQSEWVERLFKRLGALYGARFADMWAGQDLAHVMEVWREELGDFSPEELTRGVNACRTRDWPPTLPEFVKLCRPALDYERAYAEAAKQLQVRRNGGGDTWSDPAVYWAAASMEFDILGSSYPSVKARWQNALDAAVVKVRKGELPRQIPEVAPALPAPGKVSVPAEEQKRRLSVIRQNLGEALAAPEPEKPVNMSQAKQDTAKAVAEWEERRRAGNAAEAVEHA